MKKLFLFCLLFSFICPAAFAQKAVVGAISKRAEMHAKAAEKDLLELEKRFAKLRRFRSCTDMQKVSALLAKRIPEGPQRDELNQLFRSGQYAQAQSLVHVWLKGEPLPEVPAPAVKHISSRADFTRRFLQLDVYQGQELKQAVDLLTSARKEGLFNETEYRNLLWSLAHFDMRNVEYLLTFDEKAIIRHGIPLPQREKSLQMLSQMYERENLHPDLLTIPPVENVSRREAIRRVLGPLSGGKKKSLSVYKEYYDRLPLWRQQELNARIDRMENLFLQRAAAASVNNRQQLDKNRFSHSFANFVTGKTTASWTVVEVLYSEYVSEPARQKAQQALSENLPYGMQLHVGEDLYQEYAKNFAAGQVQSPGVSKQVLKPLLKLKEHLSKYRQWPQEGTTLFLQIQTLEKSPNMQGAQLLIKRLKQQQQQLPGKNLYALLVDYTSAHGKLPPSSSSLYHAAQYYKKLPGPYRKLFHELFEKYRRNK